MLDYPFSHMVCPKFINKKPIIDYYAMEGFTHTRCVFPPLAYALLLCGYASAHAPARHMTTIDQEFGTDHGKLDSVRLVRRFSK